MKITFKYSKRHNLYVTLFACAVSIWLMVTRFGLSLEKLLSFLIITLGGLLLLLGLAALVSFVIRYLSDRKQ